MPGGYAVGADSKPTRWPSNATGSADGPAVAQPSALGMTAILRCDPVTEESVRTDGEHGAVQTSRRRIPIGQVNEQRHATSELLPNIQPTNHPSWA